MCQPPFLLVKKLYTASLPPRGPTAAKLLFKRLVSFATCFARSKTESGSLPSPAEKLYISRRVACRGFWRPKCETLAFGDHMSTASMAAEDSVATAKGAATEAGSASMRCELEQHTRKGVGVGVSCSRCITSSGRRNTQIWTKGCMLWMSD